MEVLAAHRRPFYTINQLLRNFAYVVLVRDATTFSKLGVQCLGLGYCYFPVPFPSLSPQSPPSHSYFVHFHSRTPSAYRRKDVHRYSWLSNDGHAQEIDHILVNRRWTATSFRVYCKFEFDTDHRAVIGSWFELKLKRCREKPSRCRRYDLVKLRDDNLQFQYAVEIRNRFGSFAVDELDSWEKGINSSAERILGYRSITLAMSGSAIKRLACSIRSVLPG